MFALSNAIAPRTRSSKRVSPAGTLNRIARGMPDASRRATSSAGRLARPVVHPPAARLLPASRFG